MKRDPLLLLILAAIGLPACGERLSGTACIDVADDATDCPAAEDVDVDALFVPYSCDDERVVSISGVGEVRGLDDSYPGASVDSAVSHDLSCCYDAELVDPKPRQECVIGRPYREGAGGSVMAGAVARGGWAGAGRGAPAEGGAGGLPAETGTGLADAWARAGLAEHASVASFARLSLELMAHGAPAELIRATHAAALDEIDHAERCFVLAGRFGAGSVGPGPIPFAEAVIPGRPLAGIVADAVRDGCLSETVGALLAREAARLAPDPQIRETLQRIADDEARHAALAWRIVAWALRAGSSGGASGGASGVGDGAAGSVGEIRGAVVAALRDPPALDVEEIAARAGIDAAPLYAVVRAAPGTITGPAAQALLAA